MCGGTTLMSDPLVSTLLLVGWLWLGLMLHVVWPDDRATSGHPTSLPAKAPRQRSTASPPLPGLTPKPPWAACEPATASRPQAPWAPLPPASPHAEPPRGEHLVPLLSRSCLSLWRLARAGPSHVPRASHRRPLATAAWHALWWLLPRDPRHPVAWHARGARAARVGGGRAGGRQGHTGRSPGGCG
jgi:hypothetical protein